MERHIIEPRPGWRETVEAQGLTFSTTRLGSGQEIPYWNEKAMYVFTEEEIVHLEETSKRAHEMCIEAAKFLMTGDMGDIGLPEGALEVAEANLDANPPQLYGRFDFHFDGTEPAKIIEYNADTPTGLIETGVIQLFWLEDKFPEEEQFNFLHGALVKRWKTLAAEIDSPDIHFAHFGAAQDGTFEDWLSVAYLRDTAIQAGLATKAVTIQDIGYDRSNNVFINAYGEPMGACFKLYPWEDMLWEEFGAYVLNGETQTVWLEPLWKVVMTNKMLLPALAHLFPDSDHVMPSTVDRPGRFAGDFVNGWVAKPLFGREGDNIIIETPEFYKRHLGKYGEEGYVYQQWNPLPDFDGNKAVIGSWMVGDEPVGINVRESNGWITDFYARLVPHIYR